MQDGSLWDCLLIVRYCYMSWYPNILTAQPGLTPLQIRGRYLVAYVDLRYIKRLSLVATANLPFPNKA